MYVLCAMDQSAPSTDSAVLSMDSLLAQLSIDCAAPSVDWLWAGRIDLHGPSCVFCHCFNRPCALGER